MEQQKVTIIPSIELFKWRLRALAGRTGVIVAKNKSGFWIKLDKLFLGEQEWFIPSQSIIIIK